MRSRRLRSWSIGAASLPIRLRRFTPLFVMQMEDYVRASGDLAYLRAHWDYVKRAYAFTRAHTTHGAYDNSQGTGWVEEWVPKLPQQEMYLVALDEQSSEAMKRMAKLMDDDGLASAAESQVPQPSATILARTATRMASTTSAAIATAPLRPSRRSFQRSRGGAGILLCPRPTPPSTCGPRRSFHRLGNAIDGRGRFDLRPISYHHGSVWPLYTGWTSLAEYRTNRPLAAYANLRQNMQLTWLQDPGAGDGGVVGQVLPAAGAQQLAPALVLLYGADTGHSRPVRS